MIVTRFAPSPTGYLHLGHAFAAITAYETARAANGRFLLRMENIDSVRSKRVFEDAILEDLAWLGLAWETPVLRQSERSSAYRDALAVLGTKGLLYACFCTRSEVATEVARAGQAPHGPEGPLYPGTCRGLSPEERQSRIAQGAAFAFRLDSAKARAQAGALSFLERGHGPNGETGRIAVDPTLFGDVVVARKDLPASYHLAVVVDDAFQDVTLVTRGHDLFAAAHVQRVLQTLLGLPAPDYAHHRLILDAQARKFSKRDAAVTLRSLRAEGRSPADIRAALSFA